MLNTQSTRLRAVSTTILSGVLGGALALLSAWPASAANVTPTRLENADAEPQNWLMGFQDYSSHRFSRLNQINKSNVTNLKIAFTLPIITGLLGRTDLQLENYGLVDDGFMYLDDGAGIFYKVDVRSGTKAVTVWKADAAVPKDLIARSRGISMMGNAIYHNLADGRVVAVDRDSGEFLWDQQIARVPNPKAQTDLVYKFETFTAAPIAVSGKIIVANSGGDAGSRGWVAAVDAATGKEMWRFYVIPGPGEPGFETWKDKNQAWKTGGGGMWSTGSYDVEQRLTIWGTGQPQPMHDPEFRPGDNLFTNSAIALNIDDGKLKWYFQYTPNESWDYDEVGVHMLIDVPINGQMRKIVSHYSRNGFFYDIDRVNGSFISSNQYVDKVNWTKGIDQKTGKPVEYDPKVDLQPYLSETRMLRGVKNTVPACPHKLGGVRWQPPSYNPTTHIAYSAGLDGCFSLDVIPVLALPGGGIDPNGPGGRVGRAQTTNYLREVDTHGLLSAVDVTTGKVVARQRQPYGNLSGMLATAGGVVFSATQDGAVTAHDADTLQELWRFETGIPIKAAPISYAVNGKQFIAIMAGGTSPGGIPYPELKEMTTGGMLYVFAL